MGVETGAGTEVEAWHACLDVSDAAFERFAETLSEDERARAARFVFERDRRRFVAARGILRQILGSRLGVRAERVGFEYGERGKPSLAAEHAGTRLQFNVAHSHGHGLFALASGVELGADIEGCRPLRSAMAIAERFFSPEERDQLLARPPSEREIAFFLCWTRKEAYIKGLGTGLAHPLDGFSVGLEPNGPISLVVSGTTEAATGWSLCDVSRLPTYAAAIAVRAAGAALRVTVSELAVEGGGTARNGSASTEAPTG